MRALAAAVALSLAAIPAACAAHPGGPARPGPYPYAVELLDGAGRPLPTFRHRGRTYVLGALGERYRLRIRNGSAERVEAVASVDGRDVLDGRSASVERRGYLVPARGEVVVDGFRLDASSVAAFRFAPVPRSYAALAGDDRDVGVVGVAIFRERPRALVVAPRGEARADARSREAPRRPPRRWRRSPSSAPREVPPPSSTCATTTAPGWWRWASTWMAPGPAATRSRGASAPSRSAPARGTPSRRPAGGRERPLMSVNRLRAGARSRPPGAPGGEASPVPP